MPLAGRDVLLAGRDVLLAGRDLLLAGRDLLLAGRDLLIAEGRSLSVPALLLWARIEHEGTSVSFAGTTWRPIGSEVQSVGSGMKQSRSGTGSFSKRRSG